MRLNDPIEAFTQLTERRAIQRNRQRETERWQELQAAGFTNPDYYFRKEADLQLMTKRLSAAVMQLSAKGWRVEAEGLVIRRPGKINVSVTSGVDWFDLSVDCDFDGIKVTLPALLAAIGKGQNFIELGDGSRGMLPEDWLARCAAGRIGPDRGRIAPLSAVARR